MVLDHRSERLLGDDGVQVVGTEELEGPGPVDGLGHPRLLDQVHPSQAGHGRDDLPGQRPGHLRRPDAHDLRLSLRGRVVDPVVEAPALQGVMKLPRPVGGDDHDRRLLRPDGADLRDGHLEVGEHLQEEGLELVVRPVDLVDQEHRLVPGTRRLEQRTLHQELRAE